MKFKIGLNTIISSFFKDKDGHFVVTQPPNIPIVGWFTFMLLAHLFSASHLRDALGFISMAFLFTWAYLEITQGVNYFRRLLGLVVLIVIIISVFR
ncbi:MAG: hypothetical protein WCP03_03150 [Candidatus Saccharibacteria bacterium]